MILRVFGINIYSLDSRVTQEVWTKLGVEIYHCAILLPIHNVKTHVAPLVDIRVTCSVVLDFFFMRLHSLRGFPFGRLGFIIGGPGRK